uniref:Uncharacterized protein n=1 Tax=Rhizophora mucronata TaxID=61149 RepID=A0A2P2NPI4_RHIMU
MALISLLYYSLSFKAEPNFWVFYGTNKDVKFPVIGHFPIVFFVYILMFMDQNKLWVEQLQLTLPIICMEMDLGSTKLQWIP